MDHQVRNDTKKGDIGIQGYANMVPHADVSPVAGDQQALQLLPDGEPSDYKRYATFLMYPPLRMIIWPCWMNRRLPSQMITLLPKISLDKASAWFSTVRYQCTSCRQQPQAVLLSQDEEEE
jgi:hypothetical protein